MSYRTEEIIFLEESKLEELWDQETILIYEDHVMVVLDDNFKSAYAPFIYNNKEVVIDYEF
jgi:hypothetical protein